MWCGSGYAHIHVQFSMIRQFCAVVSVSHVRVRVYIQYYAMHMRMCLHWSAERVCVCVIRLLLGCVNG